jgi:uncharacterized OsmC-like protein
MRFPIHVKQNFQGSEDLDNLLKTAHIYIDQYHNPINVQLPCGYGGPTGDNGQALHYTPEHLYLGAIGGCFFTTFNVIAKNSNFTYESLNIDAVGEIDRIDGVKMITEVTQNIVLVLSNPESEAKALRILKKTEHYCLIANSVKTKIFNKFIIENGLI